MAKNSPHHNPDLCPECGSDRLARGRSLFRALGGFAIVIICGLLALPTLGVSLIFMIWGVFLILERTTCRDCGWSKR